MKKILDTFSPVSLQEWKDKLQLDLKGRTFESLCSPDRNGIRIAPFYNKENGRQEGALFQKADWDIVSRTVADGAAESNRRALRALQQGASGIIFEIASPANFDPKTLLKDINYPYIFLAIDLKGGAEAEAWKRGFDTVKDGGPGSQPFFFYDPLGDQLEVPEATFTAPGEAYIQLLEDFSPFSGVAVDGRRYHNAGANSITQLASVMAHCNEYLHALKEAGQLKPVLRLQIRMATGTLFFEEIAKLRALRKLLPLLEEAYHISFQLQLHVSAGMLHRTPFDKHNNLLRDTLAGMAAVLGGCDSLEIPAFDAHADPHSDQGDRLSLNQQLIFKEESYLNCVADAAAGSFYLDERTEALAKTSWEAFQEIETQGGFVESIRSGGLPAKIKEQADSLIAAYRSGENILVGVNKFINPDDPPRPLEKSRKTGILTELNLCEHLPFT